MSGKDPAFARFATINAVRLIGAACVVAGMLICAGRLGDLPVWSGYILIGNGLIDVFVLPLFLARKWRTPR